MALKIHHPEIMQEFATRLEPHLGASDWSQIDVFLDETPNGVYGFCTCDIRRKFSTRGKGKFVGVSDKPASITLNRKIYEQFPTIALSVILPHEMGHVVQWMEKREPGHDQFFDWVMRKMGVQEGATIDPSEYGLSHDDTQRLNMLTGKQEKVRIQHESGSTYVVTRNLWTRMITNHRITNTGLILNHKTCKIIETSK